MNHISILTQWRILLAITCCAVGLGLADSASANTEQGKSQRLGHQAVCQLIKSDNIPSDTAYTFEGRYESDDMHSRYMIELPECASIVWPQYGIQGFATIRTFHNAFREKCGGYLMNDQFSGVFTGTFVPRTVATAYGTATQFEFVVSGIESKALDIASLTCTGRR